MHCRAGCQIFGLPSNIGFLEDLVAHPAVQRGDIDTGFLDRSLDAVLKKPEQLPDWHVTAAAYFSLKAAEHADSESANDPWSQRDFWRPYGHGAFRVALKHHADFVLYRLRLVDGCLTVSAEGREFEAKVRNEDASTLSLEMNGRHHDLYCFRCDNALVVHDGRRRSYWQIRIPGSDANEGSDRSDGFIRAPMPGKLVLLKAQSGQKVAAGEELAVVEAMKMELSIKAPSKGRITGILAEAGSVLDADTGIFSWEPVHD